MHSTLAHQFRALLPSALAVFIAGMFCAGLFSGCSEPDPTSNVSAEPSANLADMLADMDAQIIQNPNDPEGYHQRALWKVNQSDPQGAYEDWGLALKADSSFAPGWENRADMLYRMQNFDACMEELDNCIAYADGSTMCLLKRAEFNIHLNQFERAFDDLNEALRINDQLHEAYWMKGKIYASTGATDKAISSYQTALEVNPGFFDGFISLGLYLAELGNPLAEEFYKSAIELRPQSVEARYNLAIYLQGESRNEQALELYREILSIDSTNATASFNQGYIHLEYYSAYDSAEYWFTKAIQHLPYYHQAFLNRGLARESQGNITGALADYGEALRIKPDYTVAALAKERALKAK